MTQEEKDLLIKDLSARLLYKVKFSFNLWNEEKQEEVNTVCTLFSVNTDGYCEALEESGHIPLEFVKPYLRPLSSMTEDEKEELRDTYAWVYSEYPWDDEDEDEEDVGCHPEPSTETYDWYNRKMFDYRGLIPKGLALEAKEGMYNK